MPGFMNIAGPLATNDSLVLPSGSDNVTLPCTTYNPSDVPNSFSFMIHRLVIPSYLHRLGHLILKSCIFALD